MNWDERIARAEKKGHFTETDKVSSNDALCCSLGERLHALHGRILLPSLIETYYDNDMICTLSYEFRDEVFNDCIETARETHNKIKKIKRLVK